MSFRKIIKTDPLLGTQGYGDGIIVMGILVNEFFLKYPIAFLDALNADRTAAGLAAIDYNDAMLEAGNIRAREYSQNPVNERPDGRSFTTIFDECNLDMGSGSQYEKSGSDVIEGARLYNIYKNANTSAYQYMMSSQCKVVCIGSIPTSETMATWVIDVA